MLLLYCAPLGLSYTTDTSFQDPPFSNRSPPFLSSIRSPSLCSILLLSPARARGCSNVLTADHGHRVPEEVCPFFFFPSRTLSLVADFPPSCPPSLFENLESRAFFSSRASMLSPAPPAFLTSPPYVSSNCTLQSTSPCVPRRLLSRITYNLSTFRLPCSPLLSPSPQRS